MERDLLADCFVLRYRTKPEIDGLAARRGRLSPCTFWLADNSRAAWAAAKMRRLLFERLLSLRNDVGLLAEEYDPATKRLPRKLSAGV